MMTKNRTQFVFIIAAGVSLISGFSQTADIGNNNDFSEDKTTKVEHLCTYFEVIPKLVDEPTYEEALRDILPVWTTSYVLILLGQAIPQFEPVSQIAVFITIAGLFFVAADVLRENNFGNARFHQHKREFSECLRKHTSGEGPAKVPLACEEALRELKLVATVTEVSKRNFRTL